MDGSDDRAQANREQWESALYGLGSICEGLVETGDQQRGAAAQRILQWLVQQDLPILLTKLGEYPTNHMHGLRQLVERALGEEQATAFLADVEFVVHQEESEQIIDLEEDDAS